MKIGIYNESSREDVPFGGSERLALMLAEALLPEHQVELVHHKPQLDRSYLAHFFRAGSDVDAVQLRYVAPQPHDTATRNPVRQFRNQQAWHSDLSAPYDIFINLAHEVPAFCQARHGVLLMLFPFHNPTYVWPQPSEPRLDDLTARKRLERIYHFYEWRKRLETYEIKLSISRYTQEWTRRRWGVDSQVLYPPADNDFTPAPKENLILSVGRFSVRGTLKRQMELTRAFGDLKSTELGNDWNYLCAGAVSEDSGEQSYLQNVQALGESVGAQVVAGMPWPQLKRHYESAKIFWHAAGYKVDEARHPFAVEHFGIVVVEAMAAGCVPVVINKGGPAEIVQHGINGFLWDTLDELKSYTQLLIRHDALREKMAHAARARAQQFAPDAFKDQVRTLLQPLLVA